MQTLALEAGVDAMQTLYNVSKHPALLLGLGHVYKDWIKTPASKNAATDTPQVQSDIDSPWQLATRWVHVSPESYPFLS